MKQVDKAIGTDDDVMDYLYASSSVSQVWSLSSLKVSWQVLRKLESSLVRFLAHDFLAGPRQRRAF